jgi:hypothetical protein
LRVRSVETFRTSVIHGTISSADVVDSPVAIYNACSQRSQRGSVGEIVTDEDDIRVGGAEPILELFLGDEVRSFLDII